MVVTFEIFSESLGQSLGFWIPLGLNSKHWKGSKLWTLLCYR